MRLSDTNFLAVENLLFAVFISVSTDPEGAEKGVSVPAPIPSLVLCLIC